MAFEVRTKREHCPKCDATRMENIVHMRPGRRVEVFVECAECGQFVASYTLSAYTCSDPFRSFLRLMRRRRRSSGGAVSREAAEFEKSILAHYREAKEAVAAKEESRDVEDLLDEVGPEET